MRKHMRGKSQLGEWLGGCEELVRKVSQPLVAFCSFVGDHEKS